MLLPNPAICSRELLRIGTYRRMADGTLRYDYSASGYRWELSWGLLNSTDRGTVQTEAERTGSMVFSPPTASESWNVLVTYYQENGIPLRSTDTRWNCTLTLETVED